MKTKKSNTVWDLERQADRIAARTNETRGHVLMRLLEAHPEAHAEYREWHNRPTSKRVCEATGVQERTLQAWQLRGLLDITARRAGGEKWRRYTLADVVCIALMKRLTEVGFTARAAAVCINDNRRYFEGDPLQPFYLVLNMGAEGGFMWRIGNETPELNKILSDSPTPGFVMVIAIHQIARDVQLKLFGGSSQTPVAQEA